MRTSLVLSFIAATITIAIFAFRDSDDPMAAVSPPPSHKSLSVASDKPGSNVGIETTSRAAARLPQPARRVGFSPPVFRSIPEGLNGRQLPQIYAELETKAVNGDARASLALGQLIGECNQRLYSLSHSKGFGSPNPAAQAIIDNEMAVSKVQCPLLSKEQLMSRPRWMLHAAELGSREALTFLPFVPPNATDDPEGKLRSHWQEVIVSGLDKAAAEGDYEAALTLAKFFLSDPATRDDAKADHYFELAGRLASTDNQVQITDRWRQTLLLGRSKQNKPAD